MNLSMGSQRLPLTFVYVVQKIKFTSCVQMHGSEYHTEAYLERENVPIHAPHKLMLLFNLSYRR